MNTQFENELAQLIEKFNRREQDAADALITHTYERMLMPLAASMLRGDRQAAFLEAGDLVTAVLEALRKEKKPLVHLKAYARTIMNNTLKTSARDQNRIKRGKGFTKLSIHTFENDFKGGEA